MLRTVKFGVHGSNRYSLYQIHIISLITSGNVHSQNTHTHTHTQRERERERGDRER